MSIGNEEFYSIEDNCDHNQYREKRVFGSHVASTFENTVASDAFESSDVHDSMIQGNGHVGEQARREAILEPCNYNNIENDIYPINNISTD